MRCTNVTHASYMLHHNAFIKNKPITGVELQNARFAHARLGYNFFVAKVAAAVSSQIDHVIIDVTLVQRGVAPFYFPLSLYLTCPTLVSPLQLSGADLLISDGDKTIFRFLNVPAVASCLKQVSMFLDSPMTYPGRPIRFAQGNGTVILSIPFPSAGKGLITGYTLLNCTGGRIGVIRPLKNGDTINLQETGSSLTIRAETSGPVSRVEFRMGANITNSDTERPFIIGNTTPTTCTRVPYISSKGRKNISGKAYNGNGFVHADAINFTVENRRA
jgi:hypothetical protein